LDIDDTLNTVWPGPLSATKSETCQLYKGLFRL
jgi:hypothetical protein